MKGRQFKQYFNFYRSLKRGKRDGKAIRTDMNFLFSLSIPLLLFIFVCGFIVTLSLNFFFLSFYLRAIRQTTFARGDMDDKQTQDFASRQDSRENVYVKQLSDEENNRKTRVPPKTFTVQEPLTLMQTKFAQLFGSIYADMKHGAFSKQINGCVFFSLIYIPY